MSREKALAHAAVIRAARMKQRETTDRRRIMEAVRRGTHLANPQGRRS